MFSASMEVDVETDVTESTYLLPLYFHERQGYSHERSSTSMEVPIASMGFHGNRPDLSGWMLKIPIEEKYASAEVPPTPGTL